ncbi:MAG: glutamate synthase large subunit [Deltaproteobacteria bacterium]|nr:glutamate synthase large subunit [Deltaproteobacteria bacterium]
MEELRKDAQAHGLYAPSQEKDACGVGFIVHQKGIKSHSIVHKGVVILNNLVHRGASGAEANTGDGAGILIQVPHEFLLKEFGNLDITLPSEGSYGVGTVFLPGEAPKREKVKKILEEITQKDAQVFLGWRKVPTYTKEIGNTAKAAMPAIEQFVIALGDQGPGLPTPSNSSTQDAFERRLFILRKTFENEIKKSGIKGWENIYIPSLSSRTLIYKGMLTPEQLEVFYPDLNDPTMVSAIALVHSRFSTNTFPNWELAHPFRLIAHNGEINTLRGNINWMRAREALFQSKIFGDELQKVLPVIRENGSDSATFDNALEMLVMAGYSLPHAVMMMIPEAWSGHEGMSQEKKDFYEYHACLMEPWDGPASIAFTDGQRIGAILDRNGLRPSRYYVTKDDLVIMASEVGVLDIAPENILIKERLHPGRMFLVDIDQGRIVADDELKKGLSSRHSYGQWLKENRLVLEDLPECPHLPEPDHATVTKRQVIFGYTREDIDILMLPMANNGEEAVGSMGADTPLAVLSKKSQNLFNYFQQLFAQVTNPPLDAIREEIVTSVDTTIGAEGNLLEPSARSAHQIKLKSPIIDNDELARLKQLELKPYQGFKSKTLPILFPANKDEASLSAALEDLFQKASAAIQEGCNILILSDRGVNEEWAAIPSLLAVAGLHHHLVREGSRTKVGLVLESGEPREVHHFGLLVGYGAGAINPYLAFETLDDLIHEGTIKTDHKTTLKNYIKACKKGIVKIMSKMGISTIQSYRGAQIFEAIGLSKTLIDKYFTHTASRIGGIEIEAIHRETLLRHKKAFPKRLSASLHIEEGGNYQWRRDGEAHLFNPDSVAKLQYATQIASYDDYKEYAKSINDQASALCTFRGLFEFKKTNSIPLEEVEPAKEIVKRFKTGAMSFGSISQEAHETLAIAMNRIGGRSNTGEGGEDPKRFLPDANGDLRRSAIKQVASGRFGVTSEYLVNADEIQIKIAQGAKPGEGGQLPGHKVYPWVAKVRYSTPGVGLISPPPHHDIYSIEDLAQLIYDLKNANPRARISVKLVAEVGVGTVAAGVAKAMADLVLISGYDGGTGASAQTSIKHAGIPWELGLAETQQVLVLNNLRDRITVEVDGQMKTGRDVAIATLLGAEEFGFSTAPLITMGCIMMRVCHLNTCPVGVATQDPALRKKFTGQPEAVINFFFFVAEELREIMAELGFRTLDEMTGRADLLNFNKAIAHWKAKGLDFSNIFYQVPVKKNVAIRKIQDQDHGLERALDYQLLELCEPVFSESTKVKLEMPICNRNRTVGTILGSEVTRLYGSKALPEDTIQIKFKGSAGQSFGAFIPKGITLRLEGDANDYVGKGLSGGKLIVFPSLESTFAAEENILIGNTVLYGATQGEAYFRGIAGERFCVRNSGAHTVVEGVGDHACEYMTGGVVVVLGNSGRNFAAGMSGGLAFVYDEQENFKSKCNKDMVDLEAVEDPEDIALLKKLIEKHQKYTGSIPAQKILQNFSAELKNFVKVNPKDYKKVMTAVKLKMKEKNLSLEAALYG